MRIEKKVQVSDFGAIFGIIKTPIIVYRVGQYVGKGSKIEGITPFRSLLSIIKYTDNIQASGFAEMHPIRQMREAHRSYFYQKHSKTLRFHHQHRLQLFPHQVIVINTRLCMYVRLIGLFAAWRDISTQ